MKLTLVGASYTIDDRITFADALDDCDIIERNEYVVLYRVPPRGAARTSLITYPGGNFSGNYIYEDASTPQITGISVNQARRKGRSVSSIKVGYGDTLTIQYLNTGSNKTEDYEIFIYSHAKSLSSWNMQLISPGQRERFL